MTATQTTRSIHLSVRRWRDRVNGNSYFSGRVYVDGVETVRMPFQYGYGSQPDAEAAACMKALPGVFGEGNEAYADRYSYLGRICRESDIEFTEDDVDGCLQRDVKAHGAPDKARKAA